MISFLELFKKNMGLVLSPSQQPYLIFQPPPPPLSSGYNLYNKVSSSIVLIMTILAIIFFISGLLHLLVRFLLKLPNRDLNEMENLTALQGQLQQLFHLHDSGVDQSFIDTLPVFNYKSIVGLKDPFDCAVCLCEFEPEDKLRLLPKCSHAFHMGCIDTWLLSHSTCPICRANMVLDFPQNTRCSPAVMVLESASESSREIDLGNAHLSTHCDDDIGLIEAEKCGEIEGKVDENEGKEEKVVLVKLGKYRSVDGGGETETSAEARRCFSMGSFAYTMDENTSLKVPLRTPLKKQFSKKPCLPLKPGHRAAKSECGSDSRRGFIGFEAFKILEVQSVENDSKSIGKRESFSASKFWLRERKDESKAAKIGSSRRAFSLRFPVDRNPAAADEMKGNGGSEVDFDEGIGKCDSLDCEANAPSFGRRTLLWLVGRENKVVDSSCSSNV